MPSVEQLRTRLTEKLEELFQLDQPDLDFGFYRIMHARSREVRKFLDKDLPKLVASEFAGHAAGNVEDKLAAARTKVEQSLGDTAIDAAGNLAEHFHQTPPGKEYLAAQAAAAAAGDTAKIEADVYDHLFRFFERYYETGDFSSRRYYARETPGRAAPYAIPYNGEEVKLHWANADQYYIKTAEHFSNYTVDLVEGVRKQEQINRREGDQVEFLSEQDDFDKQPRRIHFRVVAASEGEHNNVKAAENASRFFLIRADNPIEFEEESGELVCRFDYRVDPNKSGTDAKWQEKKNAEAATLVLSQLKDLKGNVVAADYHRMLATLAPTKNQKDARCSKSISRNTQLETTPITSFTKISAAF
ncbi:DNA methylase N-4/N-6 domain protein [Rhodopirellula maiorica SM1]|uniref:DNA methylase N-4/N-6 domain protein n=1 Tax=Rhodopirellula maiorica SM1 TaxID=1265738 RepID=M5RX02_9BACT|nr:hypothetical protein [Rhodopirellula maiorica]EMI18479.1 DNA methylase N-4/N-6 domain protein [Rhodopirellula maiorica SM1]